MTTLSGKLTGITLPIDHFGSHLNSQEKVVDSELAAQNFHYAGEALCEIWCCNSIFGKKIEATYIDKTTDPFVELEFIGEEQEKKGKDVENIERHCNLCQYALDIKRCDDLECCDPIRAEEAIDFLIASNGFLPPDMIFTVLLSIKKHILDSAAQFAYPSACGRPQKEVSKTQATNSTVFDNFMMLLSQKSTQMLTYIE
ncbi:5898_t:CDS:2, partial [Scutellospora calospora]